MNTQPEKSFIIKHDKLIAGLCVLYITAVSVFMLAHRMWFSPDQFFVFALLGSVLLGRTYLFLADWGPFLLLFFSYEFLRGLVPLVSNHVHILPMIRIDQFLFGFIPTVKFQALLYNPSHLQWYDYVAVTIYISHFVVPMLIGFIFWMRDRHYFKEYALALLLLSYAGFITFMLYPAMPPWMASSQGYIPPIKEVTGTVMSHFLPTTISVPTIYSIMRANPVAAVPSLHAAMPMLTFFYVLKKFKRLGLVFGLYVIGVCFAVMYLGEHYFTDVAIGTMYAIATFVVMEKKEYILPQFAVFKRLFTHSPQVT